MGPRICKRDTGDCVKQVVTKLCPSNPTPGSVSWEKVGRCEGDGRERNLPQVKSLSWGVPNICLKLKRVNEIVLDGHSARVTPAGMVDVTGFSVCTCGQLTSVLRQLPAIPCEPLAFHTGALRCAPRILGETRAHR